MYITIKLPPSFGSFNQLRKENYPFNSSFTAYLAAVCRLGLKMRMDVEELVGYIEDRVFDGMRLPDIPDGNEAVNMRYKTEDPDVIKYIGNYDGTNRMAVMYIARMTLRLSAAYGTSLFRLTRLINDLADEKPKKAKETQKAEVPKPKPRQKLKELDSIGPIETEEPETPETGISEKEPDVAVEESAPMPRLSGRAQAQEQMPVQQETEPERTVSASAKEALAALSELEDLTAQAEESPIVETNEFLKDFM